MNSLHPVKNGKHLTPLKKTGRGIWMCKAKSKPAASSGQWHKAVFYTRIHPWRRIISASEGSSGNTIQAPLRHVMVIEGMFSLQCLWIATLKNGGIFSRTAAVFSSTPSKPFHFLCSRIELVQEVMGTTHDEAKQETTQMHELRKCVVFVCIKLCLALDERLSQLQEQLHSFKHKSSPAGLP